MFCKSVSDKLLAIEQTRCHRWEKWSEVSKSGHLDSPDIADVARTIKKCEEKDGADLVIALVGVVAAILIGKAFKD